MPIGSITKGFQNWVGGHHTVLHDLDPGPLPRHRGNVVEDNFGGFRFPRTRFPGNDNTLVLAETNHGGIGIINEGKGVWGDFKVFFPVVFTDAGLGVEVLDGFEGVNGDKDRPDVGINIIVLISVFQD